MSWSAHGRRVRRCVLLAAGILGINRSAAQVVLPDRVVALLDSAGRAGASATPAGYRTSIRLRLQASELLPGSKYRLTRARIQFIIGSTWYQLGALDSAVSYASRAYPVLTQEGDTASAVTALAGVLAMAQQGLGRTDSALATYRRAIALARAAGDAALEALPVQNLASLFMNLGAYDSAAVRSERALALSRSGKDRKLETTVLVNLATLRMRRGDPDSSTTLMREALRVLRLEPSDSLAALVWRKMGTLHGVQGSLDSAFLYYRAAFYAASRAKDAVTQRHLLLELGMAFHSVRQMDSATKYLRVAAQLSQLAADAAVEALAADALGSVFATTKQRDSAGIYFARALRGYQITRNVANEARTFLKLAELLYASPAQRDSLLRYASQVRTKARQIGDPAVERAALFRMATTARDQGRTDSALVWFRTALSLSRQGQSDWDEYTILAQLGHTFFLSRDFERATAYFDSADVAKSRVRVQAGGDFNRTTLGEEGVVLYDAWLYSWFAQEPRVGKTALLAALAVTEQSRAQALLDLMKAQARPAPAASGLARVGEELLNTARSTGSAVLVYYAGSAEIVYSWTTIPGGPTLADGIDIRRDSLAALVTNLRALLGIDQSGARLGSRGASLDRGAIGSARATQPPGDWRRVAAELSRVLFTPQVRRLLAESREILIIPHGILALVPFALLPWGPEGELLGDRVALRYAPSLATANVAAGRPKPGPAQRPLIIGNPAMPEVSAGNGERFRLSALPAAATEARAIAVKLGGRAESGGLASETFARGRLSQASLVHFATHGFAYSTESEARKSFIALAPDSSNDGLLTVGEILDDDALTLQADLVVLSACQTGLGDIKQAEGTIGLQRAFLAKGARSVLVSLWNVSDEATSLLMTRFYAHWLDDPDHPAKAEALRRAQAEVRARPAFAHPRFWAAFQLVGAR